MQSEVHSSSLVAVISLNYEHNEHTHRTILWSSWIMSGITRVSWHQKGKTNPDLLEQQIVSGSDISWTICKSAL